MHVFWRVLCGIAFVIGMVLLLAIAALVGLAVLAFLCTPNEEVQ